MEDFEFILMNFNCIKISIPIIKKYFYSLRVNVLLFVFSLCDNLLVMNNRKELPDKNVHSMESFSLNTRKEGDDDMHSANILDNEAIIRNVLKSNPEKGFELIFRRYYKPLCSHAVRFVYSKELAEDIVSEIFTNFWKKKHYENVTSSFRAYLYRSVRNAIYNYLQSEYGRRSNLMTVVNDLEEIVLEFNTPQKILLFDELSHQIEVAVSSFPPQCQKVFILSRFEGKANKEIALEMNIKLKTVEAHMMKALATLRNCLNVYLDN